MGFEGPWSRVAHNKNGRDLVVRLHEIREKLLSAEKSFVSQREICAITFIT